MKPIVVMAFEDRSRPEGGHATLLLADVKRRPEPLRFELRLIDQSDPGDGTPSRLVRDHEAISSRLNAEGLEITIGPDITELPELTAGTAVEIEVPSLDVKGEFLWPDIAMRVRPKRRTVIARAPVRELLQSQQHPPEVVAALDAEVPVGPIAVAATAADFEKASSASRPVSPIVHGISATTATTATTGGLASTQTPSAPARRAPPSASAAPHPRSAAASVPAAPLASPLPARTWPRFAAAIIASVLAIQAALYFALGGQIPAWLGRLPNEASAGPSGGAKSDVAAQAPSTEIFDLLAPGTRSPSGVEARSVTVERAVALAAGNLQGVASQRNTAEGIFWLQHYLAGRLGDPQVVRALTQLGSAHAEPSSGPPDYAKAQRLWQIAGAFGDPIALCFLATLHSNGLGVPIDRALAARWHAAAISAGGCGAPGSEATRQR